MKAHLTATREPPATEPSRTLRQVAAVLGADKKSIWKSEQSAIRKLRAGLLADPHIRERLAMNPEEIRP